MDLTRVTRYDLLEVSRPKFPRGSCKGEFRNHAGKFVSNLFVVNHRVYLANCKEFGNGEIVAMIPGNYSPKDFERAGGFQWTSNQYVKFYRFRLAVSQ